MEAGITKQLIFDNFANKVTPLQRKQIDAWLQEKDNEELYYKWLEEWENRNPEYQPDSEAMTEDYLRFIRTTPRDGVGTTEVPRKKYLLPGRRGAFVMAAAVALLLVAISLWIYRDTMNYKSYRTANGETRTLVLVDGSEVMLNASSSLKVPRWGFGGTSRVVVLDGEANFSVRHTSDDQTFVVKTTKNFEVVVLGTEFTVFSRQRGAKVALTRGKVQVNYREGSESKRLIMKPGELLSFNQQNQASLKHSSDSAHFSLWQEKQFVFEETTLSDVAQMLEETYGLKVEISSRNLARRTLMGSFRADNLDELLQTISDLLDINAVREEDSIRLSEKNP